MLAKGQLVEQAHKTFGPLAGIAMNVFSAASETADTRSWSLLPAAFLVTRIDLSPGEHAVEIYSDGKLSDMRTIRVEKGEVRILRSKANS